MSRANNRLIAVALVLLSATGCGIPRATEPEPDFFEELTRFTGFAQEPRNLPGVYGVVLVIVWLLVTTYAGHTFVRALLNSVRFTGLICLVTAPLMFAANQNVTASLAVGISGLVALVVTTVAFKKEL